MATNSTYMLPVLSYAYKYAVGEHYPFIHYNMLLVLVDSIHQELQGC